MLHGIGGGEDDDDFHEYLRENCYDLHYAPVRDARPFSCGVIDLWRIAVDWSRQFRSALHPPCSRNVARTAAAVVAD